MEEAFEAGVTDIAWSSSGSELFASSMDGTIIYIAFEPRGIGAAASPAEKDRAWANNYGWATASVLVESVEHLQYEPDGAPAAAAAAAAPRQHRPLLC